MSNVYTESEVEVPVRDNDIQTAVDAGKRIGELEAPRLVDVQGVPHLIAPRGMSVQCMEDFLPRPRRIERVFSFKEIPSFGTYVRSFSDDNTRIFMKETDGKRQLARFEAIIDDHEAAAGEHPVLPRWATHRAVLELPLSPELLTWREQSGKAMSHIEFVQFLEGQIPFIVSPDAADIKNAVNNFKLVESEDIDSVANADGGDYTVSIKKGSVANTRIPTKILLALRPHTRAEPVAFHARVNWFKSSSGIRFAATLTGWDGEKTCPCPLDITLEKSVDRVRLEIVEVTDIMPLI